MNYIEYQNHVTEAVHKIVFAVEKNSGIVLPTNFRVILVNFVNSYPAVLSQQSYMIDLLQRLYAEDRVSCSVLKLDFINGPVIPFWVFKMVKDVLGFKNITTLDLEGSKIMSLTGIPLMGMLNIKLSSGFPAEELQRFKDCYPTTDGGVISQANEIEREMQELIESTFSSSSLSKIEKNKLSADVERIFAAFKNAVESIKTPPLKCLFLHLLNSECKHIEDKLRKLAATNNCNEFLPVINKELHKAFLVSLKSKLTELGKLFNSFTKCYSIQSFR